MATVMDTFESLLSRVRVQDVDEQSVRTFEDEQQGEIYRLLLESRGRLRQQEFVEQMEFSPPKISKLLSAMEENGDVVRLKVGREKIVCLPEMVPNQQL